MSLENSRNISPYVVLSGVYMDGDGVGVLRGRAGISNVVPDADLRNDGT